MPDDLAAVIVLVQDLANTARTELQRGANVEDILSTIVNAALDDDQADEAAMVGAVAIYLLARQDWTIGSPAATDLRTKVLQAAIQELLSVTRTARNAAGPNRAWDRGWAAGMEAAASRLANRIHRPDGDG